MHISRPGLTSRSVQTVSPKIAQQLPSQAGPDQTGTDRMPGSPEFALVQIWRTLEWTALVPTLQGASRAQHHARTPGTEPRHLQSPICYAGSLQCLSRSSDAAPAQLEPWHPESVIAATSGVHRSQSS